MKYYILYGILYFRGMYFGFFYIFEEIDRFRIYEFFFGLFNLCFIFDIEKKKILRKNNILIEWIFYEWEGINLFNKFNFDDIEDFY